jgi:hypothetical protein
MGIPILLMGKQAHAMKGLVQGSHRIWAWVVLSWAQRALGKVRSSLGFAHPCRSWPAFQRPGGTAVQTGPGYMRSPYSDSVYPKTALATLH